MQRLDIKNLSTYELAELLIVLIAQRKRRQNKCR